VSAAAKDAHLANDGSRFAGGYVAEEHRDRRRRRRRRRVDVIKESERCKLDGGWHGGGRDAGSLGSRRRRPLFCRRAPSLDRQTKGECRRW
jgi:hypothetical protein